VVAEHGGETGDVFKTVFNGDTAYITQLKQQK